MPVAAGTQFTAYLADPGGDTVGVGARIEVPVTRAIASMWVAGTLSEDGTMWSAVLDAPGVVGDYLIVWMTGDDVQPFPYPVYVPLQAAYGPITPTVGGEPDYPDVTPEDVMPDLADVAILERTRTRGDDGTFYDTFNANTFPSDTDVQAIIVKATDMVLSQLREDFNPTFFTQVSDLISLQAAIMIEASFFRNQDAAATLSSWRLMFTQSLAGLQSSIEVDREQAVVFAGMEPRQPDWDTDPWLRYMGP